MIKVSRFFCSTGLLTLSESQTSCEARKRNNALYDTMRELFIVVSGDVNCGFPHMEEKDTSAGRGTCNH